MPTSWTSPNLGLVGLNSFGGSFATVPAIDPVAGGVVVDPTDPELDPALLVLADPPLVAVDIVLLLTELTQLLCGLEFFPGNSSDRS